MPAWPLLALLVGFPVYWVTGASLFAPAVFAAIMATLLLLRGEVSTAPGVLVWLCFLTWVVVCALSLAGVMQMVGYAQRSLDLVAIGVALLYYVNARETITPLMILRGFCVIWCSLVVLGWLAIFLPNARITTPVSLMVPASVLQNELVHELVRPRLAEVQEPWGAEEPFVRPAAPFPYTNSWGMAYALLTPLMIVYWSRLRTTSAKVALGCLLAASVFPAAQTSNRGMLLALGFLVCYLGIRYLFSGNLKAALGVVAAIALGLTTLSAIGVFEGIAERQEVSDTTAGRSSIYAATFEKVLESPLVGWATPRLDVSIGVSLGTQGFAWTLMYSYGFVGLALFYLFLGRVFFASWHFAGGAAYVLHGLIATVAASIWFYGLGPTQCLIIVLVAGILSRASVDGELNI